MVTVAAICESCGLISVTRRSPSRNANCIKCEGRLNTFRAHNVAELRRIVSAARPVPYSSPIDEEVFQLRIDKALERFFVREQEREQDKALGSAWATEAYFARKGLREAKGVRRRIRRKNADE